MVLKLDHEKAYDRVRWSFLKEILDSRGFGSKWRGWLQQAVRGGSLCICMKDENSIYFKPGKGLRQGDPLSLLLFNLEADVFSRMLMKATRQGFISGFVTSSGERGHNQFTVC